MELRPSKFLPSQLGFRPSVGHPDKQTDKQDEEGHIKNKRETPPPYPPNKIREEGTTGDIPGGRANRDPVTELEGLLTTMLA